ncbi:MAG: carboxylating nicotinate-nucleotide diphosphorylase [Candidatus Omnitrophota bacterium]|jgi:nicotinate-nucleotide pyrophosphorylase (carboxylating)
MKLSKEKVFPIIISALKEDIGPGDITGSLLFEKDVNITAHIFAKEDAVVAGMDIAKWTLDAVDEKIVFTALAKDGERVRKNKRAASLRGSAKAILSAERTILNFLGHLSGIATLTAAYVKEVKGTRAEIYNTRKTIPGMRELEKYAVNMGGGSSYRLGLWDGVMIKDNHLKIKSIEEAIGIFTNKGYKNIEAEVENIAEFKKALEAGANIIMLDNMKIEDMKKAVKLKRPGVILEASGGISLDNVKKIAKSGVDRISVGKLTHSAPSIDFSLEVCG